MPVACMGREQRHLGGLFGGLFGGAIFYFSSFPKPGNDLSQTSTGFAHIFNGALEVQLIWLVFQIPQTGMAVSRDFHKGLPKREEPP